MSNFMAVVINIQSLRRRCCSVNIQYLRRIARNLRISADKKIRFLSLTDLSKNINL